MSDPDIAIKIEFPDGVIELGGGDEFFVAVADGQSFFQLDDARLNLVQLLQKAREDSDL